MTLGEFRKYTDHLNDSIKLAYHYGGKTIPIKSMDALGDNTIEFASGCYGEKPIYGDVRVASFLKKKEETI